MLHRGDREMSCRQGDRPGYLSSEQVWCAKITFKCNNSFQSCCPRSVGRPWLCDLWLRHCSEAEQQVCEGSWQESKNCPKAGDAGKCSLSPNISLSKCFFLSGGELCDPSWEAEAVPWGHHQRLYTGRIPKAGVFQECVNGWATFLDMLHTTGAFDDGG